MNIIYYLYSDFDINKISKIVMFFSFFSNIVTYHFFNTVL